jgi:hypothetical protein
VLVERSAIQGLRSLKTTRDAAIRRTTMVSGRAKHIDIRRNFVQSHVALGVICECECSTDDMVADLLTKAVTKEVHLKLRDRLMGCPPRL